jgi:formimidoylglutamate deiminase
MAAEQRFFAERAWVGGAWAENVLLHAGDDGRWCAITPQSAPGGAVRLAGPVLPGVVDAHSHAFQRAIAGLTERAGQAGDDFWSWRDRMYHAALRITPAQLEAIATQLYAELLAGGYTHVCEFHYLHNDTAGRPYADPLELSLALVRAAARTGIGLTLLPTLYMRSGFGASGLREDQRRFASTPESVMRVVEGVRRQAGGGCVDVGIALHSLRAVPEGALHEIVAAHRQGPIHIHIAEQTQEVDDCLAQHGQRPIEWLLSHASVDARWNLVHATHTTPAELRGVRDSGAAIVLCPSTEANLGDGVFDLPGYAAVGGRWSIGSDSHVTRRLGEELRMLEYSQRLALRQRNVAARVQGRESSAAALFEAALAGGEQATAQAVGGLAVGQRADLVVLDGQASALAGIPPEHVLDALVFSSPDAGIAQMRVAGRAVELDRGAIQADFGAAMRALWA